MSNYGWVPQDLDETDGYLERLALLVARRPLISMIQIADTLQGFIEQATARAAPPPAIDDELVVGGHANQRGDWMVVPFSDPVGGPWTDFDALVLSLAVPSRTLAIPDALVGYSPANPDPTARAFHVKGCNVGRVEPWLLKLRAALGGHVRVTAPKHFHGISTNGTEGVTPLEIIEWMGYQFVAFRKTAFASLDELAAAFYAQGQMGPDGVRIPLAAFRTWLTLLPVRNLHVAAIKEKKGIGLPLRENIGGHRYAKGQIGFYIRTPRSWIVYHVFSFQDAGQIPSTAAGRVAMLPSWFAPVDRYQSDHPFPEYKRLGYATLAEMIDGLEWKCISDTTATPATVACIGGRFEYELLMPIANPGPGGTRKPTKAPLIYNHIPESGPPITTPSFDETSPFYYGTVP